MLYKLHIYRDPSKLPEVSPAQEEVEWAQAINKTIVRCFSFFTSSRVWKVFTDSVFPSTPHRTT
jgi:hypothetical protein